MNRGRDNRVLPEAPAECLSQELVVRSRPYEKDGDTPNENKDAISGTGNACQVFKQQMFL